MIAVEGLAKRYAEVTALDGVSFAVHEGEVFGILGPNGAGKTTTLEMIEGMRPIDGGSATVDGLDVAADPRGVKARIGIQLQASSFFDELSLVELLDLFGHLYHVQVDAHALLAQVELTEKAKSQVQTLSGGQKQRFSIAAALVNDPRVLFLDEPTTGLDPRNRTEVWEAVRSLAADGTTVLLTTQYLDEADHLASQIVIVDHGRAVATGTPTELKRRIGGNVIEVHAHRRDDLAAVAAALDALNGGEAAIDEATRRVTVGVDADGAPLVTALRSVEAAGVEIDDIALRRPTLDEVFLALTGRAAAG